MLQQLNETVFKEIIKHPIIEIGQPKDENDDLVMICDDDEAKIFAS